MSKIKYSGLDQYGAEPFKQQEFGTAGVEGVKVRSYGQTFTVSKFKVLQHSCFQLVYVHKFVSATWRRHTF